MAEETSDLVRETMEASAVETVAAAEVMASKKRQEGIIQRLAERENPEALSIIRKSDPPIFDRLHFYYDMVDAIRTMDDKGFRFPDFHQSIETELLVLNRSKGGKIIDVYKSSTHVIEGSGSERRGIFGRKK